MTTAISEAVQWLSAVANSEMLKYSDNLIKALVCYVYNEHMWCRT